MKIISSLVVALFIGITMAGCTGENRTVPAAAQGIGAERSATSSRLASATSTLGPNLYVSNGGQGLHHSGGSVTVYGLENGKLLQKITTGVNKPESLAFSPAKKLFVLNREPRLGSVAEYAIGATAPTTVITEISWPNAIAFDTTGNTYVASVIYETVFLFAPDANRYGEQFGAGTLSFPDALALDSSGNMYVADLKNECSTCIGDNVSVVSIPKDEVTKTITDGISSPRALAMSAGHLYVANAPFQRNKVLPYGSITVYPLGKTAPSLTITQGIHTPVAMAFDGTGNLYVANINGHSVSVYAPNSNVPLRIISQGATSPKALAIGRKGDLYVANFYQNTISVYAAGSSTPRLTITNGIDHPNSIALSPE